MRRSVHAVLLGLGLMAATPAFASQCVEMIFFDDHGAVVSPARPVIGIMVGGNPVISGNVPFHSSRKPGMPTACPQELVATVQALFDTSCPTEDRRKKAATTSNTTIANINAGCASMAKALQPGDGQTP